MVSYVCFWYKARFGRELMFRLGSPELWALSSRYSHHQMVSRLAANESENILRTAHFRQPHKPSTCVGQPSQFSTIHETRIINQPST